MLAEQVRKVVHRTVRTPVAIKRGVQTTPTLCPVIILRIKTLFKTILNSDNQLIKSFCLRRFVLITIMK